LSGVATTAPRRLVGQLVLVTGGAVRVGRAICEELAHAGAQLAIHYHQSAAAAESLAATLGQGAFALPCDLRDAAATTALFAAVQARSPSGRIDALVNSAASFSRTPFASLTEQQWQSELALNLTAPQRCSRLAVEAGAHAIVNLVDIAAWQPWPEFSAYCVSKAGLLQLTRVLARELAPRVRVNAVAPGTVLLPDSADPQGSDASRLLARIPLGRIGDPSDVARAVRFLLTEPYLTGVCLPVDGGQGVR
jgi:pteridine reductase